MRQVTSFLFKYICKILYTYIYTITATIEFNERFIGYSLDKSWKILNSLSGV